MICHVRICHLIHYHCLLTSYTHLLFANTKQCVSCGPPLAIGDLLHEHEPCDIDEYEYERVLSRRSNFFLNYYQRKHILGGDYTEQDFKEVKKEINRIKSRREISKYLARFKICLVEAAIESTSRKFKRALKR